MEPRSSRMKMNYWSNQQNSSHMQPENSKFPSAATTCGRWAHRTKPSRDLAMKNPDALRSLASITVALNLLPLLRMAVAWTLVVHQAAEIIQSLVGLYNHACGLCTFSNEVRKTQNTPVCGVAWFTGT